MRLDHLGPQQVAKIDLADSVSHETEADNGHPCAVRRTHPCVLQSGDAGPQPQASRPGNRGALLAAAQSTGEYLL
ncbi:hypothetical protein [Fodinicola feengrottensis]|uniref:hypothetical protein n=1 Tax=Fodinicola feengrottensis TaxID=435914 RepID=UPI0031CDDCF7